MTTKLRIIRSSTDGRGMNRGGEDQTPAEHPTPVSETFDSPVEFSAEGREWATRTEVAVRLALSLRAGVVVPPEVSERFISQWSKLYDRGLGVKLLKFHLAYIFAKASKQAELPPIPKELKESGLLPGILGPGWWYVRCRDLMHCHSSKNFLVAYDVLMSKFGCGCVGNDAVEKAYDDQVSRLTRAEPEVTPVVSLENTVLNDGLRKQIDDLVDGLPEPPIYRDAWCTPSIRACSSASNQDNTGSVAKGGAFGHLLRSFRAYREERNFANDCGRLSDTILYSMYDDPYTGIHEIRLPGNSFFLFDEWKEFINHQSDLELSDSCFRAHPTAIKEPLKVRMVTAGPPASYYRALGIQKLLHTWLRNTDLFRYIGQPIDEVSWAYRFRTPLQPGQFYVSGDYEAATDNLDPYWSEYTFKSLCRRCNLSPALVQLGLKCLTGHSIKVHGKQDEYQRQTWGQLMGSPISFPILNVVNAAASSYALGWSAKDCLRGPMVCNGDDIAFITDKDGYERWKEVVSYVGLKPSLGKNYISTEFLIMNSELRLVPEGGPQMADGCSTKKGVHPYFPWRFNGFINMALLTGVARKGIEAGQPATLHWTHLSDISRQLVRGLDQEVSSSVMEKFIYFHKKILDQAPEWVDWHISESLGGVGLPFRPEGKEVGALASILGSYLLCLDPVQRIKSLKKVHVDETMSMINIMRSARLYIEEQLLDSLEIILESKHYGTFHGTDLELLVVLDWTNREQDENDEDKKCSQTTRDEITSMSLEDANLKLNHSRSLLLKKSLKSKNSLETAQVDKLDQYKELYRSVGSLTPNHGGRRVYCGLEEEDKVKFSLNKWVFADALFSSTNTSGMEAH